MGIQLYLGWLTSDVLSDSLKLDLFSVWTRGFCISPTAICRALLSVSRHDFFGAGSPHCLFRGATTMHSGLPYSEVLNSGLWLSMTTCKWHASVSSSQSWMPFRLEVQLFERKKIKEKHQKLHQATKTRMNCLILLISRQNHLVF